MPQSFTCLRYHLVWGTKGREPSIGEPIRARLYEYIGGIVRSDGGRLLAAGGMPDHLHLLVDIDKQRALSDAVRTIKANSSKWVHDTFESSRSFAWQTGYGAFTVSHSTMDAVKTYIANQAKHHRTQSFQDEFVEFLRRHDIEFDERYLWK